MSQDELAEKLNVTRQSISLWETGQTQPSLDNIIALAKLFDISTDTLLTENDSASVGTNVGGSKFVKSSRKIKVIVIASICFVIAIALITIVVLFRNDSNNTINTDTVISDEAVDPSNATQYDEKNITQTVFEETTTGEDLSQNSAPEKTEEAPSNNEDKEQLSSEETTTEKEISQSAVSSKIESTSELPEKQNEKDIYAYLKSFVVEKGILNGDYCYYSKTADNYGGYSSENFSLYYWGDTDTVEFTLHSVLDDTFSVNFYLLVPKEHTGNYEYISSLYYRDTGEPLCEAKGMITAGEFTKNYPLNSAEYIGSTDTQNEFMEMSRQGICDLIGCLENFIIEEKIDYSFYDFGFCKF